MFLAVRRAAGKISRKYRQSDLCWYVQNARPRLDYALSRPRRNSIADEIATQLRRDGIAIVKAEDLVPHATIDALAHEVAHREELAKDELATYRTGTRAADHKARYRFSLLGNVPAWDASSPFAHFALSTAMCDVANAYQGLQAVLRYYNVWRTFPVDAPPGDSQLWHRDREDRLILKAFLYLTDVTNDAGPLSYIPGSHRFGGVRVEPEAFKELGHSNLRSSDDQMAVVVDRSRWRIATGSVGTLVFVDTAGFHKGGFSQTRERNVFTCMYTSPASAIGDLFDRR